MLWAWIVAIGLYSYGKDTPENKLKRKEFLICLTKNLFIGMG